MNARRRFSAIVVLPLLLASCEKEDSGVGPNGSTGASANGAAPSSSMGGATSVSSGGGFGGAIGGAGVGGASTGDGSSATSSSDGSVVTSNGGAGGATESDAGGDAGPRDDCQPSRPAGTITVLVPAPSDGSQSTDVVVTDSFTYFVDETSSCFERCDSAGSLRRVPHCGGAVQDLTSTEQMPPDSSIDPKRLAAGGGYVYFLLADQLLAVRESDLTTTSLGLLPGCGADVAANDSDVFVYDICQGAVLRAAHGSAALAPFAIATTGSGGLLGLGPNDLFYQRGSAVWRQGLTALTGALFVDTNSTLVDLAADGSSLVLVFSPTMVNAESTTVRRYPLDGSPSSDLGTGPTTAFGTEVVADGGETYFDEIGDYGVLQVARAATGSSASEPVLRSSYTHLTVHDGRLYWTERGALLTSLPEPPIAAGPAVTTGPAASELFTIEDMFRVTALLPDGTLVSVGTSNESGFDSELAPTLPNDQNGAARLVALSPSGSIVWSAQMPNNTPDSTEGCSPDCVTVDGSGNISVVVDEPDRIVGDTSVTSFHRFTSSGTESPSTRETELTAGGVTDVRCAASKDDGLYVAFGTGGVLKKTATGTEAWRKTLSGVVNAGANAPTDMAATSSGFAYVSDAQNGVSSVVEVVGDDGSEQWTRVVQGVGWAHIAVTTDGQVVVVGDVSGAVDAGSGPVDPPRPFQDFTVTVVFASDGTPVSTHFLDGSFEYGAVAAGPANTLYLLSGSTSRPFYFDPKDAPGNYVPGVTLAKIDLSGALVFSRNVSPILAARYADRMLTDAPAADTFGAPPPLYMPLLVANANGIVVTGGNPIDPAFWARYTP